MTPPSSPHNMVHPYVPSLMTPPSSPHNLVHPYVPSLMTPPSSPHNRVQNKHVKILHRCRILYLCFVQRVLKTHWDSRRIDWTRFGRYATPVALESD